MQREASQELKIHSKSQEKSTVPPALFDWQAILSRLMMSNYNQDGFTYMSHAQLTIFALLWHLDILQPVCRLWMGTAAHTVTDNSTLSLPLLLLAGLVELQLQESRVKPLDMWLCGLSLRSHHTAAIQRTLSSELVWDPLISLDSCPPVALTSLSQSTWRACLSSSDRSLQSDSINEIIN